ncbi:hypothetical protein BKA81DRAFT_361600 [Phyllosticta paracitricarpa]
MWFLCYVPTSSLLLFFFIHQLIFLPSCLLLYRSLDSLGGLANIFAVSESSISFVESCRISLHASPHHDSDGLTDSRPSNFCLAVIVVDVVLQRERSRDAINPSSFPFPFHLASTTPTTPTTPTSSSN